MAECLKVALRVSDMMTDKGETVVLQGWSYQHIHFLESSYLLFFAGLVFMVWLLM